MATSTIPNPLGTITTGSVPCTVSTGTVNWYKRNGIIIVKGDMTTNASIPSGQYTTLATLPNNVLPNTYLFQDAGSARTDNRLLIEIQTDGTIRAYNYATTAYASGSSLRFCFTYFAA